MWATADLLACDIINLGSFRSPAGPQSDYGFFVRAWARHNDDGYKKNHDTGTGIYLMEAICETHVHHDCIGRGYRKHLETTSKACFPPRES